MQEMAAALASIDRRRLPGARSRDLARFLELARRGRPWNKPHLMADDLAQGGRLLRRADQAVDAEHLRLLGTRLD